MKAIVLSEPGAPQQLKFEERPIPQAGPTTSVVEVKAFGLNHAESITRQGGSSSVQLPRVIGIELVGVIHATNAPAFEVGQPVYSFQGGLGREIDGSYQEFVAVPNDNLYPLPQGMGTDWTQLATIPQSGYTAFGSMKVARVQAGDRVLLRGGTTTVGIAAIKLLQAMHIQVAATTRRPEHLAFISQLGAQAILDQQGVLQTKDQFDGIIDLVGVTTMPDTLKHIKVGGTVVETGELNDQWGNQFNIFDIPTGTYLTAFKSPDIETQWLTEMLNLIKTQRITFPIGRRFDFQDIVQAHQLLDAGQSMGKIVIQVKP